MAADASAETFKFYRYDPSMGGAVIFILLFLGITGLHTFQLVRTRTWFFIPFVLGGHLEWLGYIGRALSAKETPDWTVGPYVMQTLLLLVAPALYAASIYMILGRIITLTESESYCIIPRKWLTKIFVVGDVLSFLLQGGGGGIMTGGSLETMHLGEKVIIVGLIVQVVFFTVFAVTAVMLHIRLAQSPTRKLLAYQLDWKRYLYTLYGASGLIMVRSVFRLIEYAQGNDGQLVSHEIYMYIFDGILMLATMLLFAWQHPSEINALLNRGGKAVRNAVQVYWLK